MQDINFKKLSPNIKHRETNLDSDTYLTVCLTY